MYYNHPLHSAIEKLAETVDMTQHQGKANFSNLEGMGNFFWRWLCSTSNAFVLFGLFPLVSSCRNANGFSDLSQFMRFFFTLAGLAVMPTQVIKERPIRVL